MRSVLKNYMGMIAIAIVLVLAIGALGVRIDRDQQRDLPSGIDATPAISGNSPEHLVDVSWLMKYQNQVDYIFDLGDARVYDAGHIPNARHIWWQDAMRLHTQNYGEADQISSLPPEGDVFGKLNLNVPQNARIVLYDSNDSERATWMKWVMNLNGYTDVLVLDGGLSAWIGAGGETTTEPAPASDGDVIATPTYDPALEIRREDLLASLEKPDVHIIDTRSAEQQEDDVNGTIRTGHIPGSINVTNADVMRTDGTFKSADELKQVFASYGLDPANTVVVYGLFTMDTGNVWLALQIAGYDSVQVYSEGFVAWGFNEDLPLSTEPYPAAQTPVATPATPVTSPAATAIGTPAATPEDGPVDLTGNELAPATP